MRKILYKILYAYNVSQRSSVTSQYAFHINYFRYMSRVPDQVNIPFSVFASPSSTVTP
jgi:hypothetical protein